MRANDQLFPIITSPVGVQQSLCASQNDAANALILLKRSENLEIGENGTQVECEDATSMNRIPISTLNDDIPLIPSSQNTTGKRIHHYRVVVPTIEELTRETLTNVPCHVAKCEKKFANTSALRMHMLKTHNLNDNYSEDEDDEASSLHTKRGNSQPCLYFCPVVDCKRSYPFARHFTRKSFVRNHYLRTHCDKRFVCSDCDQKFPLKHDLSRHKKVCGQIYVCECKAFYSSRQALVTHASRHKHSFSNVPMYRDGNTLIPKSAKDKRLNVVKVVQLKPQTTSYSPDLCNRAQRIINIAKSKAIHSPIGSEGSFQSKDDDNVTSSTQTEALQLAMIDLVRIATQLNQPSKVTQCTQTERSPRVKKRRMSEAAMQTDISMSKGSAFVAANKSMDNNNVVNVASTFPPFPEPMYSSEFYVQTDQAPICPQPCFGMVQNETQTWDSAAENMSTQTTWQQAVFYPESSAATQTQWSQVEDFVESSAATQTPWTYDGNWLDDDLAFNQNDIF